MRSLGAGQRQTGYGRQDQANHNLTDPDSRVICDNGLKIIDEVLADRNVLFSPDAKARRKDKRTENNSLAERMRKKLKSAAERSLYAFALFFLA